MGSAIGPDGLCAQLDHMFEEMHDLMHSLPGNVARVANATLLEEFRHWYGTNFDGTGSYSDDDIWRDMYEDFEERGDRSTFYKRFMTPCGLTELALLVKYPLVHQRLKEQGVIK